MTETIIIPNAGYESFPTEGILTSDDISLGRSVVVRDGREIDGDTKSPVQNQYADKNYAACGAYAASQGTNAMNADEGTYGASPETTSTGKQFREIQKKEYRGDDRYGSYQIDNINMLEKYGYIAGKYHCKNQAAADEALDSGFIISTGSKNIDREATKKNNWIAVRGKGSAHLFILVDKLVDKRLYVMRDSGGPAHGINGRVFIPFDLYDTLYTPYALIDKQNTHILDQALKNKADLAQAIALGITNGRYLDAYAERRMAAILFARIAKLPITGYTDEELENIAVDLGIRGKSRPNDFVTRYEVALMAAGLLGVRTSDDKESIKKIIEMGIMQSAEETPILREHLIYVVKRCYDSKA